MAQDDSRWQDLMKMQETANSATNPASDQPSGQFNADDIEFESFMFDTGTGPLPTLGSLNTDPNMGVATAVNPLAANLAAHTGGTGPLGEGQSAVQTPAQPAQPAPATPGFDFSGQAAPLPPFLAGRESQTQQQAEPEPLFQPYQSSLHAEQDYNQHQTAPPSAPRGTGPLGSQHSGSNLAARLSQLQGQQGNDGAPGGTMPRGTGPLGMRRGTGPLGGMPSTGTGPLRTPASASTAGAEAESESAQPAQPSPAGPINPAYFKTPTGPLGQRLRTGPLNPASLRPEPEEAPAVPAPVQASTFAVSSTYTEQVQNDPTTWNDSMLSSVEDFSQVLLALYGLPANLPPVINEVPAGMAAMSAGTAVQERPDATQEWAGLPFEDAYSASTGPALAEPAVTGAEGSLVPGWGEMTGAPPENNYTSALDEVAAPGYDGPQLDYVVPLDEVEAHAQAPQTVAGGASAGDALEFDSFMFDDGHPSQLLDPSVLQSQQPAPTASGMDAFLQPRDEFDLEPLQYGGASAETQAQAPAATTPEATQAEAEMEPATEDTAQGPLPFWLQDTSDLEVLARQGYVDMDLGTGTQDAEDQTLSMQTADPLAPPAPVELEQEARAATPDELTGVTAEDATESPFAAPAEFEPAAEEGFTQAEEFDIAPFDASMMAPTAEAEASGDETELELAPTFQADTYAGPQAEPEAEPTLELEAEPAVEVAAQAEADVPADDPYYADLPPIEPFDFTSLGLAPEEDSYGFNTQELLGVLPPAHDPMRATADLDVLADIFDGTPAGNFDDTNTTFSAAASLDATPTTQNAQRTPTSPALSQLTSPIASFLEPEEDVEETATQSQLQAQLRAQMEAQAQAATQPEPLAEDEPVEPAEPVAPQPPRRETGRLGGGWTSAVTTTLSMGGIDDDLDMRGIEAQETGLLFEPPLVETAAAQPTAVQPATPEPLVPEPVAEPVAEPVSAAQETPADPGFDIEPFDYSQLRLEEEQEIPTGMLDPRKARRPGTTGELISPDPGGSLWSERPAAPAEEPEDDEESWQGTERDTSLFMSTSRPAADRGKSTGWLTDDAAPLEEPARPVAALPATPAPTPTPTPEAAVAPEPEAEAQTETTRGKGRKKGAADDSSSVKARVSWADATSPGLPTLPDSLDLQGMTTGPLGQEAPEVEDVEATVPQGSKQTRALRPTPEMAPEAAPDITPDIAPETPTAPGPKRPRGRAAATAANTAPAPQASPVETPALEPVQEAETVEDATPAAPVAAEAPAPAVPTTSSVAPTPTATPVPVEVPEYTYQPMQGQPEASNVEMPKVGDGRSMYTSGPLPELEGFEALRQLVEANPDDIGAHMALAAGYSQLGDLSTTLRVYRRVLRKRNVPAMFLSLIAEELNDYEREMQGDAHYHQVRGDLYMKQGRHQEAIQEYNKIK